MAESDIQIACEASLLPITKVADTEGELKAIREFCDNFDVEVHLSAGAEFIVAVCGDIMTMPGLSRVPSADNIHLNDHGLVEGLF